MTTFPDIPLPHGKTISSDRVFLIAEIGSNHAGSLDTALAQIDSAAACGADAVKFQSIRLDQLYHQPTAAVRALHRKIDLPEDWHAALKERCDRHGVIFFSSPTYLRAVDLLEGVGAAIYKLASAQVSVFPQVVAKVARLGKPVILSTGLVTEDELARTISLFAEAGNPNVVVLHCNSVYPASADIVHLPRMTDYHRRYTCRVGFSDHTLSDTASVAAVALGACVIERHFTVSREIDSPDAPLSLLPEEFARFARSVREAEAVCRPDPRSRLEADETSFRDAIRHSPVALRDIAPGEPLGDENVALLRGNPEPELDAWAWRELVSSAHLRTCAAIPRGQWIQRRHFTFEFPV